MVFDLVRSIVFDTFRSLNSANKGNISPFLAVLILGNARIHVGLTNDSDMAFYIKVIIDKGFIY